MGETRCRKNKWALAYMRIFYTLILVFQFNGEINSKIVSWLAIYIENNIIFPDIIPYTK